MAVAKAAPITPHPSGKMKITSSTALATAVTRLHDMAYLGEPSSLMMNSAMASQAWNTSAGVNHRR